MASGLVMGDVQTEPSTAGEDVLEILGSFILNCNTLGVTPNAVSSK